MKKISLWPYLLIFAALLVLGKYYLLLFHYDNSYHSSEFHFESVKRGVIFGIGLGLFPLVSGFIRKQYLMGSTGFFANLLLGFSWPGGISMVIFTLATFHKTSEYPPRVYRNFAYIVCLLAIVGAIWLYSLLRDLKVSYTGAETFFVVLFAACILLIIVSLVAGYYLNSMHQSKIKS